MSVHTFPDSFVSSRCWKKYGSLLERYVSGEHEPNSPLYEHLVNRNTMLLRRVETALSGFKDTPRQKMISTLDGLVGSYDIKTLSKLCRQVVKDSAILVNTILEWSSTSFRLDKHRLYLGVRLLRRWKDEGIEVDHSILQLIRKSSSIPRMEADSICRLVSELIRSRHFSTSKYLQWLLAIEPFLSGCPQDKITLSQQYESFQSQREQVTGLPLLLLRNIPLQGLPEHTLNFRQTLLGRHGYSVQEESKKTVLVREAVLRALPVTTHYDGAISQDFCALETSKMENRSMSAKASQLIHSAILARRQHQISICDSRSPPLLGVNEFDMMRRFFENNDEFIVFADVMKVAAKFCERTLLYDVAFTLNWHLEVFRAIGVAECIFWNLYARAENISSHRSDELPFLLLLADLSERLPSPLNKVHFLRDLIRRCNPPPPIAVCSPVADPDSELLDGSDVTFFEEMEMVLTSGNSMDKVLLSRLFSVVTARVEKEWMNYSQPLGPLFDLLNRLRQFDEETLDGLLTQWLKSVATPKACQNLPRIVVPLVCSAMTTLSSFLDLIIANMHTFSNVPDSCELARQMLSLLILSTEHVDMTKYLNTTLTYQTYRWAIEKDRLLRTETPAFSFLFRTVLGNEAHNQRYGHCNTCALISKPSFANLLHTLIIFQPKVRDVLEEHLASDMLHGAIDQVVDQFFGLNAPLLGNDSVSSDTLVPMIESRIKGLLDVVDDFNIAFARLHLIMLLKQLKGCSGNNEQMSVMTILISVTLSSNDAKYQLMLQLYPTLGSAHALEVNFLIVEYTSFANCK